MPGTNKYFTTKFTLSTRKDLKLPEKSETSTTIQINNRVKNHNLVTTEQFELIRGGITKKDLRQCPKCLNYR